MRARKTLSSWLTNRYLLIIRNEENFAEKSTFSFTYARVILIAVVFFVIMLFLSLFLVKTVLNQWFDPRYAQMEASRRLAELTVKVDSLALEVESKDRFINNFKRVLSGDTTDVFMDVEEMQRSAPPVNTNIDVTEVSPVDSMFRQEFEQTDMSLINTSGSYRELREVFLFSPIAGFVSAPYNAKDGHYGVDVVAKKNEPVKCIADGTVIMASWTQDSGYVIAVQHRSNLISVYKHNAELLKKVGNFVNAGEIISIIGNTGDLTDGPHLHFELWLNGNSVNPEEFVTF
ncbi:M23 family metallopeptidase [Fulvivirga sedimenti]|uniref:M23 family metallopeptidase n=1 Tax=Fulvivirga sedimenti TaxID=2879465 RepID=A0A9X1HUU7_9BACT|nr:M23 family metallopeptidase [Fulvivirga sedimenti]MCA6078315.1 M23 family metallopeptidase [Fulvivirga sedimenti]